MEGVKMHLSKYKQNLRTDNKYIYSYETKVAEIKHSERKINQLGWWSVTTQKHINYVCDVLRYELDRYYYEKGKTEFVYKGIESREKASNTFNMLKNVCAIGGIINDTKEERVKFNKRMLSASGVTFPDDFDTLPIEEQEKRINLALDTITTK